MEERVSFLGTPSQYFTLSDHARTFCSRHSNANNILAARVLFPKYLYNSCERTGPEFRSAERLVLMHNRGRWDRNPARFGISPVPRGQPGIPRLEAAERIQHPADLHAART